MYTDVLYEFIFVRSPWHSLSLNSCVFQGSTFTRTPHTLVMTPAFRAFYERHIEDDLSDTNGSDSSHESFGDDYAHDGQSVPDDNDNDHPPPILEEEAFAHLVDSHFGPDPMCDGGSKDWDQLEKEARTPLFEGATSSR